MAVAAPRAPAQAKVRPPYPLVPAPKTTTSHEEEGDACEDAEGIESFLHQRVDESGCAEKFSKRTRWAVLRLAAEATTESVYDDMWAALGKEGKRWLSVAEHRGALWALLCKGWWRRGGLHRLPRNALWSTACGDSGRSRLPRCHC